MKVIIDDKIPYIKGALEPFAEVLYLPGKDTTPAVVKEADALITRTRTICNESLLKGSKVSFIATATIGFDHIDTAYCEQSGITWTNAPGCNAKSVEQYIASVLFVMAERKGWTLAGKTLGVVGVGQVGSKVARLGSILGMKVLLNDPPRARNEGEKNFHDLERILTDSDIITLHPTLEKEGPDKTFHLLDASFFAKLRKPIFLINTARGAIVETAALKQALANGQVIDCALDCWENEPSIDQELLERSLIATPHIAGYSSDGKANATRTVLEQLNQFFHLNLPRITPDLPVPESPVLKVPRNSRDKIASALLHAYDPMIDTTALKKTPANFDTLRSKYVLRREYKAYRVLNASDQDGDLLRAFGFQLPPHPADKVFIEN